METLDLSGLAFGFLEVLTVRFYPLPRRRQSLPSSLKRQIASDIVCRVARDPTRDQAQLCSTQYTRPWALRCMSRCSGQVVSLTQKPPMLTCPIRSLNLGPMVWK
ncbi:hypothetical protein TNCV_2883321 [Trichonephila clavipes]|nr:hypothetical protein TNCV_2883321 [Trichonephila clavipes]